MPALYSSTDAERPGELTGGVAKGSSEPFRSPWRRDYARLIHCPSFRRLQGKTQVFPGHESDFYRNRLTHSLEVAQIAKSIAIRLNATAAEFSASDQKIEPDIVEFAGLAHDLGHPPFGHNGEEALDECMSEHGGFEGNAQTLRIVSRLEKKAISGPEGSIEPFSDAGDDLRCGLRLTYRSLAALLKYDRAIPERRSDRSSDGVMKGYYKEDEELVKAIKEKTIGDRNFNDGFKTIECSIMDVADDIAYSTYDLEDNFKAGFMNPLALLTLDDEIYQAVAETINVRIAKQYPDYDEKIDRDYVKYVIFFVFEDLIFSFTEEDKKLLKSRRVSPTAKKMFVATEVQAVSKRVAQNGYARINFTSSLIQRFLDGIEVVPHQTHPQLHKARLSLETFLMVEVLKNLTYYSVIRAPGLQVVEYRGKDIIKSIFKALAGPDGTRLLPDDFRAICSRASEMVRYRAICDFIAGMTDRYAFEFYSRLFGTNSLTVHKPF